MGASPHAKPPGRRAARSLLGRAGQWALLAWPTLVMLAAAVEVAHMFQTARLAGPRSGPGPALGAEAGPGGAGRRLFTQGLLEGLDLPEKGTGRLTMFGRVTPLEAALLYISDELLEKVNSILPPLDYQKTHKTCACVGTSPSLLEGNIGSEIDNNHVVLRFNDAPVKNFHEKTGHRTTFRAITHYYTLKLLGKLPGVQYSSHGLSQRIGAKTALMFGDVPVRFYPAVWKANPDNTVLFLSPELDLQAQKLYHRVTEHLAANQELDRAKMSAVMPPGLQAILFLMARCDIVNVYGFNPITTDEPRSYYDPEISESDIMADEAVSFVLTVLSIEGKITWIN